MTRGERLVRGLHLKQQFYDAHERRAYVRSVEVATRIVNDPSLIARGREFLDRFVRPDRRQARNYLVWDALLNRPPEEIARKLLEDSESGASLRDSAMSCS